MNSVTLPTWASPRSKSTLAHEAEMQTPAPEPAPMLPDPVPVPERPKVEQLAWTPDGVEFHSSPMDRRDGWRVFLRLLSRDTQTVYSRPEDRTDALMAAPIRDRMRQLAEQVGAKYHRLQEQLQVAQKAEAEAAAELLKLEEQRQRLVDAAGDGLPNKLRTLDAKIAEQKKKRSGACADAGLLAPLVADARQQVQQELRAQQGGVIAAVLDGLQAQRRAVLARIIEKVSGELWELAAVEAVIRGHHNTGLAAAQVAIAEAL